MEEYIQRKKEGVRSQIDNDINIESIESVVTDAIKFSITDTRSKNFQEYYFTTINNTQNYLSDNRFFHNFKSKYALQGINNSYLDSLEENKQPILRLLNDNRLIELYFEYFAKARLMRRDKTVLVDLGSFFAKLVHTFKPNEYCALDNPIKNYFGLRKESFYIAFMIISLEYKAWINQNPQILMSIRKQIAMVDTEKIFDDEKLTDMKIMDLLFWRKANKRDV
jgi:hypothetical protein